MKRTPPPTIDFNEVTAVITKLTVSLERAETQAAQANAQLEKAVARSDLMEQILDHFLEAGWRDGELKLKDGFATQVVPEAPVSEEK